MHPYYEKNKKKYNKDIYELLSYIKDEVTETFGLDFETVVKTVQDTFVAEFLSDMPYVGGSKNANDTANLVGGCEYAALFSVGIKQGIALDKLGYLLHLAVSRQSGVAPKWVLKLIRKIISLNITQKFLVKMADKSKKFASIYPYAWIYEYEKPDEIYSHKLTCTRCGMCKYIHEKGLGEIMPYICNLDFVGFGAFGLPYYRDEVIGYGDSKCTNLFKRDAAVIKENWPPHGFRGEGLK